MDNRFLHFSWKLCERWRSACSSLEKKKIYTWRQLEASSKCHLVHGHCVPSEKPCTSKLNVTWKYITRTHSGFFFLSFSPVPFRHVSHAFNPLPAEHVESLCLVVVKGHIATHISDVNQWRKQTAEVQKNLLTHPRYKEKQNTHTNAHTCTLGLWVLEYSSHNLEAFRQTGSIILQLIQLWATMWALRF